MIVIVSRSPKTSRFDRLKAKRRMAWIVLCLQLLIVWDAIERTYGFLPWSNARRTDSFSMQKASPLVWIEDAEEGFVDEDENLEAGEVCLKSLKSFASATKDFLEEMKDGQANSVTVVPFSECIPEKTDIVVEANSPQRFLGAGALVQRPRYPENIDGVDDFPNICDAWMADSILHDGGPNLQLKGALQILDELLLFHLQNNNNRTSDEAPDQSVRALQNFVVHCGDEEDETSMDVWRSSSNVAASRMAAKLRGFSPLREMVKVDSIYHAYYYDHDLDGMVLDCGRLELYRTAATVESSDDTPDSHRRLQTISSLLPDEESIRRHSTKRFSIGRKGPRSLEYE